MRFLRTLLILTAMHAFGVHAVEVIQRAGLLWNRTPDGELPERPVDLQFIVNFYDPIWNVLWIEQDGAGSYLTPPNEPLPFKGGDRVRVQGSTVDGKPEINWKAAKITNLESDVRKTPVRLTDSTPTTVLRNAVVMEAEGYLTRFYETDSSHMNSFLRTRSARILLNIQLHPGTKTPNLGEVAVRVRGVNAVSYDAEGRITEFAMWVDGSQNIEILHSVAEDPVFEGSRTTIRQLNQSSTNELVRISGYVRSQQPGKSLAIADETGQISLDTWQTLYVEAGETVEVAGYPDTSGTHPTLRHAVYRRAANPFDHEKRIELTLAHDVRALNRDQAAKQLPVTLRGVVTWAREGYRDLFVQDSSGGIYLRMPEKMPLPKVGQEVEIRGNTAHGAFAPYVFPRHIEVLGPDKLPGPRAITLEHALTGTEDSQWVEIEGYLRRVQKEGPLFRAVFSTETGDFEALTPQTLEWAEAVGGILRIRGVCGVVTDKEDTLSKVLIWVPEQASPEIIEPAPIDPFSVPERSLANLRRFNISSSSKRRIKTSGVVTAHVVGRYAVLQDGTDGLMVLTRQRDAFRPGERVEASGFLGHEGSRLVLREAILRPNGTGTLPKPVEIQESTPLESKIDLLLVESRGTLVEINHNGREKTLTVQTANRMYDAVWPFEQTSELASLRSGSELRITGVGQIQFNEYKEPRAFRIRLRSFQDIEVLKKPPVITTERALLAVAGLAGVVIAGAGWVHSLRRTVRGQTSQLSSQLDLQTRLQAQYRNLIENASDWIFTLDPAGTITSFNPAGERITGYRTVEAIGLSLKNIVHPEDVSPFNEHRVLSPADTEVRTRQFRIQRKGGGEVWIETKSRVVQQPSGELEWLSVARDITEHRQVEEELRKAKAVAEQSSRAKSQFLANMSHEIRTPMNGVIGMTSLLLDTSLNAQQKDFTETIRNSAEALLTVINDILDFSKIEAGKLTLEMLDFDLRETIETTISLLAARAAAKGIELNAFVPYQLPCLLRGDSARLRQVLMNLVANGVKFTEKGEVSATISVEHENETDVVLLFEVADSGIGISQEAQIRLFQPFTQADNSTTRKYGGTGLGLAISQRLVEQMGGKMTLRSREGEGSTFSFTLPFRKQLKPKVQFETSILKGLRALVVDDNATNRKILHHYVISWGMRNGSVASGPEALDILRKAAFENDPYAVVLLDYQMPEMDGVELAARIKADPLLANVRMIMLTSLGTRLSEDLLSRTGIAQCLQKPVRQSEVFNTLATVVSTDNSRNANREGALERPQETKIVNDFRILLAEDNSVNQRVALFQLRKLGYVADIASNGKEVLEALQRSQYDAIIMDCQMPELDGYETTRVIRQKNGLSDTYIIAMTANAMEGDREKCLQVGMNDYIPKPTRLGDLETALKKARKIFN